MKRETRTNIGNSSLQLPDLPQIRKDYHIPSNYALELPPPSDQPESAPSPFISFTIEHLRAGLRFPIHPFFSNASTFIRIPLFQLVPNAIRYLVSFFIILTKQGVTPTPQLFYSFFLVRSTTCGGFYFAPRSGAKFLTHPPHGGPEGWRRRFFYVSPPQGRWDFPTSWVWSLPELSWTPEDLSVHSDLLNTLLRTPLRLNQLPSCEYILHLYRLSPQSIPPPQDLGIKLHSRLLPFFITTLFVLFSFLHSHLAYTAEEMQPFTELDDIEIPEHLLIWEETIEAPAPSEKAEDEPQSPIITDQDMAYLGLESDPVLIKDTDSPSPKETEPSKRKALLPSAPRPLKRPNTRSQRTVRHRAQSTPPQTLPRVPSLLQATPEEALALMDKCATTMDRIALKRKTMPELHALLASHILQMGAILESATRLEDPVRLRAIINNQAAELRSLKALVKNPAPRAESTENPSEELSVKAASLEDELNRFRVQHQDELTRLQLAHLEEVEQMKRTNDRKLEKLTASHQKEMENLQKDHAAREEVARLKGRLEGQEIMRDRLIEVLSGPTLLDGIRDQFLRDFFLSRAFFDKLVRPCKTYFKFGFQMAVKQALGHGLEKALDPPATFRLSAPLAGFEGDPEADPTTPWWKDSYTKVLKSLQEAMNTIIQPPTAPSSSAPPNA